METVEIERDGYRVKAEVGGIATGPGIAPGLEVKWIERTWIHEPETFRDVHGVEPNEENLERIVQKEHGSIDDALIDEAMVEWN